MSLQEALASDLGPTCRIADKIFALEEGEDKKCIEMGGKIQVAQRKGLRKFRDSLVYQRANHIEQKMLKGTGSPKFDAHDEPYPRASGDPLQK